MTDSSGLQKKLATPTGGEFLVGRRPVRVAFAAMPFGPLRYPALGLTLLKGVLSAAGCAVALHYPTVRFARAIGEAAYDAIAQSAPEHLVGEWVFAEGIEQLREEPGAYVDGVLLPAYEADFIADVLAARSAAAPFIERTVETMLAGDPHVVGFTSTFAQNAASLAAARRIKQLRPSIAVVLGGANCEGEMANELVRRFPFVDAVVSGEGEEVIVPLVERLSAGQDAGDLPGVYVPGRVATAPYRNAPTVTNLDGLPLPDFDDFLAAHAAPPPTDPPIAELLAEASRGCWWGQKHHCTFCGLNGSAMRFRSKSPERFVDELQYIAQRYGIGAVAITDNILDHRYFSTALPMLAERRLGLRLFFEIKANLRRHHVAALAAAGVTMVQPGIESLDTGVLRLMRKGVTALQNVQLLRLCEEYRIRATWNILFGFPGEDPAAYERMAALVPLLTHLRPPDVVCAVRLDRFSPLFDEPEALGVRNVRPAPAYAHVYGEPLESLRSLAYYFEFDGAGERDARGYADDLVDAVREWRERHEQSDLCTHDDGSQLLIFDRRAGSTRAAHVLSGLERAVYNACDEIQSPATLGEAVHAAGEPATAEEIGAACRRLVGDRLMLEDAGKYLSLGVAMERVQISSQLRNRLAAALAGFGSPAERATVAT
jgi:ribosomal peptide maturation radical SAM protein 1